MAPGRTTSAAAAGTLLVGVLAALPQPIAGAAPVTEGAGAAQVGAAPGDVVAMPATGRGARSTLDYWTPERMAAAVPLDVAPDGTRIVAERSDDRATDRTAEPRRLKVPRTAGKLFFVADGQPAVCSAASIRTRRRNQVITAGHCVHTGPGVTPGFYGQFVFVPRYHRGRRPLGKWVANGGWVFEGWSRDGRFAYDQAILSFARRHGRKLVAVTGGNTVVWEKRARQRGVRIWGWPAERPFNGERARHCQGRTTRVRGDSVMRHCPLTGGASGGPWLQRRDRTANKGRIYAVTSRRLTRRPVLLARPIPRAMQRMIRAAN
jgi:hypothetical protein